MNEPCSNERCLRCHPELKTFDVQRERVERIVRSLTVRAVDEAAALAAFMDEASGPGSYMFDSTKGPALEMNDPVIRQVEDHTSDCWHDFVDHLPGCTRRMPREPGAPTVRYCECTLPLPWRQLLLQRDAELGVAQTEPATIALSDDPFWEMTSCDACGDAGCCDPECWRCHSPIGPRQLQCLAKNLATAAALCHAWQQRDTNPTWFPGCAR